MTFLCTERKVHDDHSDFKLTVNILYKINENKIIQNKML